ncbi:hypothetical protein SDC9_108480 [bioreactor metagenome]|uniref:Uncharacterized protein n=1 Tax=bioreactor metagenome TaxID=1076179 RepID=A0A645B837_9ZZZZ
MIDGVGDGAEVNLLPVQKQSACDVRAVTPAENAHGQLRAPRAHQTADAHDLAPADIQAHMVANHAPGVGGVLRAPVPDLHGNVSDMTLPLGKAVDELTAHHALDDALLVKIVHTLDQRLNGGAVADDGDFVRNIRHLGQLVGNDDTRHALGFELKKQVQQLLGVRLVEGGGGFIQNQQADVFRQRLGDLHQLLFANADIFNLCPGRFYQPHGLEVPCRKAVGLVPVNAGGFALLVAEEHVLSDREVGDQRQLLMDDGDAFALTVVDLAEFADLAVIDDIALIGAVGVDAGQDVHQRRFSGAVLAH